MSASAITTLPSPPILVPGFHRRDISREWREIARELDRKVQEIWQDPSLADDADRLIRLLQAQRELYPRIARRIIPISKDQIPIDIQTAS